jgi:2-iminobutanoate/2-iminopropanoate deaminase
VTRRTCYEIPGVDHGSAPIPMAARVGNSFQTSGIMGKDPSTNSLPEDGRKQVEFLFANARKLLEVAGVADDQVVYVDVLLADNDLRGAINEEWTAWFPDPHDRPARHTTVRELPGGMVAQLRLQAVVEDGAA